MPQRKPLGFTVIELMITVAVLVILIGLAVPSFRDLMDKSRLRGATDGVVNLLNFSRINAVKLGKQVNVSVNASNWCAGAVDADSAGANTPGNPIPVVSACDCTATTVACTVGGQNALVLSSSYSGVTVTSGATNILLSGKGGITFNPKFGSLDLGTFTNLSALTLKSPTQKYSTQITVSPLGEVSACSVGGKFISGYPSC
jgi:type IV fimbrial biogenesis protein FimT